MIKISNIHKSFANNQVLCGIDLSINKGEVVVILGASGSGKSTFLRCLNALEKPDNGTIYFSSNPKLYIDFATSVNKKDILELRRKSGMVFQQYNLFPHKTAIENIIEGPIIVQKQDLAGALNNGRRLLKRVGLEDKENFYPHQLSGGQQQRVGIARAMAINSKLMLFDEPTSALDPELIGEVLQVMKSLANEGKTMIIVTHEIDFAKEVADRIIFIDKGKIIEIGSPKQVIDSPKYERTKRFLNKLVDKR